MDGTTQLLESDRRYLVHPLHHPDDHRQPLVVVEGKGAILRDAEGREYIDGLSGLWNVNVGHGRGELADAAHELLASLVTNAPPRDRQIEASKAQARAADRFRAPDATGAT